MTGLVLGVGGRDEFSSIPIQHQTAKVDSLIRVTLQEFHYFRLRIHFEKRQQVEVTLVGDQIKVFVGCVPTAHSRIFFYGGFVNRYEFLTVFA